MGDGHGRMTQNPQLPGNKPAHSTRDEKISKTAWGHVAKTYTARGTVLRSAGNPVSEEQAGLYSDLENC